MQPQVRASLPEVIDSTIRAEYVACHTKGYYSFQRMLGPQFPSIDLVAGGAFAKGLEIIRKLYYGPAKFPLHKALEQGILAAILEFGDTPIPEGKETKGPDRVATALAAYFERFPPDIDHVQPHYNTLGEPSVEYTFSIPLPIKHPETGNPFVYAGRFDMLGVYQNQLVVVDEKTTSQLGPSWKNKWTLRGQFTGYVWACHSFGLPVIGAIARGVAFYKETKANPSGHGFEESVQLRPKYLLDQWYEQLLHDVENMVRAWENNWYDQDFSDTCADYGGCPFERLCTAHNPETWIEPYYSRREWNPLAKVPYVQPKVQVESVQDNDLKDFLAKV